MLIFMKTEHCTTPGFLIKSEPAPYLIRGMTYPTPCHSRVVLSGNPPDFLIISRICEFLRLIDKYFHDIFRDADFSNADKKI